MSVPPEGMPRFTAHPEDSSAIAEDIPPIDLERSLATIGDGTSAGVRLQRASLYSEYAMSTPGVEYDAEYFRLARAELKHILTDTTLPPRHMVKFKAALQLRYEGAFLRRANYRPITEGICTDLQEKVGYLTLGFLGEKNLSSTEYGQVSELVAIGYLLDSEDFPWLASWREEANLRVTDNHDIYTLHAHDENRVKKAPGSVKFRQLVDSEEVVGLTIGRIARDVIIGVPPYDEDPVLKRDNWLSHARATRLAADILVCHVIGDTLSDEDQEVKQRLTTALHSPLVEFASRSSTPNYASNAEILRKEIAEYERKQRAWRRRQSGR